jgi:PIN domain nuclease of toxin-antitoxin system
MTTKYVVDTHALVWFVEGNPRLGARAKVVLEDQTSELIVPIIVLAEACWLIEHGRTSIPTIASFLVGADADPRVIVVPLDRVVLDKTLSLTAITEMHDRQIVATALLLTEQKQSVAVLTKDTTIRDSGLVPVIW